MKNKFNVLIKNKISVAQNVQCSMLLLLVFGFWVFFFLTLYEVKYRRRYCTVLLYPEIIIKYSIVFIDSEIKFA